MMNEMVERLEREVRWLKRCGGGLALVLVALVGAAFRSGGGEPEILRVRGLVIVDDAGRERILIGAPIPHSRDRVRTDTTRVRMAWSARYPDAEQYMTSYREYRHHTNGLLILDEHGFDRLALGDPVPDPNIGRRIAPSTGLVINDPKGNERSAYGLLRVGDASRVVLGLDSDRGEEGLAIVLDDAAGRGIWIRDGAQTLFLGNAAAGNPFTGTSFHGLLFLEGARPTRVIGPVETSGRQ
jgi:hypothetical protein